MGGSYFRHVLVCFWIYSPYILEIEREFFTRTPNSIIVKSTTGKNGCNSDENEPL